MKGWSEGTGEASLIYLVVGRWRERWSETIHSKGFSCDAVFSQSSQGLLESLPKVSRSSSVFTGFFEISNVKMILWSFWDGFVAVLYFLHCRYCVESYSLIYRVITLISTIRLPFFEFFCTEKNVIIELNTSLSCALHAGPVTRWYSGDHAGQMPSAKPPLMIEKEKRARSILNSSGQVSFHFHKMLTLLLISTEMKHLNHFPTSMMSFAILCAGDKILVFLRPPLYREAFLIPGPPSFPSLPPFFKVTSLSTTFHLLYFPLPSYKTKTWTNRRQTENLLVIHRSEHFSVASQFQNTSCHRTLHAKHF